MTIVNPIRLAVASLSLVAFASACAQAGERVSITGHQGGYDQSEVLELTDDHILITLIDRNSGYFFDPPNDKTPFQHAAGPCRGTLEIKAGVASGGGWCVRTNPEGGRILLSWEVSPDIENGVHGTWMAEGVSGNAVGWKGGGTWDPTVETGDGYYVETFSGWVESPD
jgi:hypothetical protein